MNNNNCIEKIEEIKTACETPLELFKSDEFLKWVKIILKKINFDNTDYILSIFTKAINKEQLNTIEESILLSILKNKDFEEYWNKLLKRLPESKITTDFKNSENLDKFNDLFKEIKSYDWLNLIIDTFILSIRNKTDEITDFQKIEKFNDHWKKVKEILKKYFPDELKENLVYSHSMYDTISNFINHNKNYEPLLNSGFSSKISLFYSNHLYEINSNTFIYLCGELNNENISEDDIKKLLPYYTTLNKIYNINIYQINLLLEISDIWWIPDKKIILNYITFINKKEDLEFFKLIIKNLLYNNWIEKIIEKYIYKQLPDYMLQSRWEEWCYYKQLLEEKWTSWDYSQTPYNFHRLEVAKLILKIWMKNYIKLYEYNKEKLKEYLDIDIDKIEKGIWKLEKLTSK